MRDAKQIEADAKAAKPARAKKQKAAKVAAVEPSGIASGGFRFATPAPVESAPDVIGPPKPAKKPAAKNDPALVRKVRTLRDLYLLEVNSGRILLEGKGTHDVGRALPGVAADAVPPSQLLPAPRRGLPAAA